MVGVRGRETASLLTAVYSRQAYALATLRDSAGWVGPGEVTVGAGRCLLQLASVSLRHDEQSAWHDATEVSSEDRDGALMSASLERPGVDRFDAALYTVAEAARYLDVPDSSLARWTHGYRQRRAGRREVVGEPLLTALPRTGPRGPVIPFIGLAEGVVLTAMRRSGVPLQRIRPALARLEEQFGLAHALASKRLYTDGAEVLFDYAETGADPVAARAARDLVVVRNDQRVFNEIVEAYLRRLDFGADGYPRLIHLPAYEVADVIVDPSRGFGQPIFARGGARLEDALALFRAGEPLDVVAEEYGIPREQLEDAVRIATRPAA